MSKFGWDLPPGVTTNMLPGNSVAEQEEEALADMVYEMLGKDAGDELAGKIYEWASKLRSDAYSEGYNQGMADAEIAKEK